MERLSQSNHLETALLRRYGLQKGNRVALEKIATHAQSAIPVGHLMQGVIQSDVNIGEPISFDSGESVSPIRKIEERAGELLIHTSTSTYRLRTEKAQEDAPITFEDIEAVETAKGSSYRYLPNGTTQRYKHVEGRDYDPQSALVYVPDWKWVQTHATPEILKKLGKNETFYIQNLLEYVQNPSNDGRKVYIVDKTGKQIETNDSIQETKGPIYLAFMRDGGGALDFSIPVSHTPKLGWMTFDTRRYIDEKSGEEMRERHLGNAVVKIVRKEKSAGK